MIIYVCSPYAGDIETNTQNAARYCRMVVEEGFTPFAPHLLFPQFVSEDTERSLGLKLGMTMLEVCDELWVFGTKVTPGMAKEMIAAADLGIPIRFLKGGHSA